MDDDRSDEGFEGEEIFLDYEDWDDYDPSELEEEEYEDEMIELDFSEKLDVERRDSFYESFEKAVDDRLEAEKTIEEVLGEIDECDLETL